MHTIEVTADGQTLCKRVAQLLDSGRIGAARPLLAAARRLSPASPELAILGARLAVAEGVPELSDVCRFHV